MRHRRWQRSFAVVVSGRYNVGEGDPLSLRAPGVLLQDFCVERLIILIASAVPGIVSDGHAVAGGLSQLDAVSDDRLKVPAAQVTADFVHYGPDKRRPARVQREEHSGGDPMPGLFLQRVKSLQLLSETMEGKEAGIHGYDRFRAGPERIDGKQTDIRRAVNDREVVLRADFGEVIGEDRLAAGDPG